MICFDNMTVLAYINHQGSLKSHSFHKLARHLLLWAQGNPLSLKAVHVPGRLNQGADMLSRDNVSPGECKIYPQMVQMIWSVFGKAEVGLSVLRQLLLRNLISRQWDALAQAWPSAHLYTFLPISLLPRFIRRVSEVKYSVFLVAPLWRNQVWFPSWFRCHQQPFGKYYWGRTFSHKLRAWFGTWGQSCGAFMLGSVNLKPMLLKTALLLALESVMRVGYLQAL